MATARAPEAGTGLRGRGVAGRAQAGRGRLRDVPARAIRIEIAGVSGDIANVVVHSAVYVEYVLLARTGEGWRITSTLWRWADGNGPRA